MFPAKHKECTMFMFLTYDLLRKKAWRPDPFIMLPKRAEEMIKNGIVPGKLKLVDNMEFKSINGRKYKYENNGE